MKAILECPECHSYLVVILDYFFLKNNFIAECFCEQCHREWSEKREKDNEDEIDELIFLYYENYTYEDDYCDRWFNESYNEPAHLIVIGEEK